MDNSFTRFFHQYAHRVKTQNGADAYDTTFSKVYDLFAFGGAYRERSDLEVIQLFVDAFKENQELAMRCLFYIADIRGGQGERRFFRVCYRWMCENEPKIAEALLPLIGEYRRYDDILYASLETDFEKSAFTYFGKCLTADQGETLIAKWAPSINASKKTRQVALKLCKYMNLTPADYRKLVSQKRANLKTVETLMSSKKWDDIDFAKLPSKAGLKYAKAFANRDETKDRYQAFIDNKETIVNASTLYPYDIVRKVINNKENDKVLDKYWKALPDYLEGKDASIICVVDTSGSMTWVSRNQVIPIDIAISLGIYTAERLHGVFRNKMITFSREPRFIYLKDSDIASQVRYVYHKSIVENTDLEAVFELLLKTIISGHVAYKDIPKTICVISDMAIDYGSYWNKSIVETEMEYIRRQWSEYGYQLPKLVYWNVNAFENNILDSGPNVSYVSGASPIIFKQVLSGKTGYDLMLEAIGNERYDAVANAING